MDTCAWFGVGGGCIFPPEWVMILLCVLVACVHLTIAKETPHLRMTYTLKAVNVLLFAVGFMLISSGLEIHVARSVLRILLATLIAQDIMTNSDIIFKLLRRWFGRKPSQG